MENNDGNPNLDEMGKMITFLMNNQGVEDFLGYSPAEMQNILYNPLEENSIVRFHFNSAFTLWRRKTCIHILFREIQPCLP